MITLVRPFLGPPFYPERSHASRISASSGRDRSSAAFSTPIGPEESVPTRIGAAGAEKWGGRRRGVREGDESARGGVEGRHAVGVRNRKTGVDCPCALGWLLERWHGDAYLRLPGVPLARTLRSWHARPSARTQSNCKSLERGRKISEAERQVIVAIQRDVVLSVLNLQLVRN